MYSFIKNIKSNMLKFTEKASDDSAGPANAKSKAYHASESKVPNGELVNKMTKRNFTTTVRISWKIQGYYWLQ